MMPNNMRGQASAIYLFVVNFVGLGIGPSAVAILTDYVFRGDESVLRQNLIPTPNASHWSHIAPIYMLYSNSQYENHSICKR